MSEWYYIGHYGQLGPLTREQVDELVSGGVITRETYVWRSGMTQWQPADLVSELSDAFKLAEPFGAPPPPPVMPSPHLEPSRPYGTAPYAQAPQPTWAPSPYGGNFLTVRSDRNRALGGFLQLIIPGSGRVYLGYAAYGILQFILTVATCGVLWIWSFIDGLVILAGGLKLDGYGRVLED